MNDDYKSFEELAEDAYEETDREFESELKTLLAATREDLEKLRPQTTDESHYEEMIAAVEEATQLNESKAQLMSRLKKGGGGVFKLGIMAARMMTGV